MKALPVITLTVVAAILVSGVVASKAVAPPSTAEACAIEMSEDEFWSFVDDAASGDNNTRAAALRSSLNKLTADELVGFELAFRSRFNAAYTWDLWGAAYVANGGASDDGFAYFRYWLISRGHQTFEKVIKEPDDLADIVPIGETEVLEFEEFSYVAMETWVAKSGKDYDAFGNVLAKFAGCESSASEPSGRPFRDDPGLLQKRYPKLWRRFGATPLR